MATEGRHGHHVRSQFLSISAFTDAPLHPTSCVFHHLTGSLLSDTIPEIRLTGNCPWAFFKLLLEDSRGTLRAHQHLNPVGQRGMVYSSEQGHSEPPDLFLGSVIRCNWVTHLCLCRSSRLKLKRPCSEQLLLWYLCCFKCMENI